MLSAIQSWIKSKQRKNRRSSRRAPGRTLRVESLEHRELLAADMAGVVRGSNQYLLDTDRDPAVEIDRAYGLKDDIHVTGNWRGKGDFAGVVRAGHPDGLLHWYLNTDKDPGHEDHYAFGLPGDIPVTGDWNGDGRDDVGVVRADAKGFLNWYLNTDRDPEHEHTFLFGRTGDKPLTGIWKMPEVTVAGGDLDASGKLNFGAIEVGQSAPTRKIVLRNDGTTNLALKVAKVPRGFTVVTGLPSSLRPGRTATLVLRIESTTVARFNDQLRIATNDGNETTLAFAVKGEVRTNQPAVNVAWRVPDGQWVTLRDGASVSLPTVVQGQGDGQIRIRIRNTGGGTLQPSNLRVPASFVHLGGTLQPATRGQSHQITIGLDTSKLGTRTGRLSFATNDAQVGQFDIVLKGTVDAAVPQASVSYLVDCPNSVSRGGRTYIADSGVIAAWQTGQTVVFQIQNTGNAAPPAYRTYSASKR